MSLTQSVNEMEATPQPSCSSSSKEVSPTGAINCYVCNVDIGKSSGLGVSLDNYPLPLYAKIFNHLANVLVIKDSRGFDVQLSEEQVKDVGFCGRCHVEVLQLYRLSNSVNCNTEAASERILFLTNCLKFRYAFRETNDARMKKMIIAGADCCKYRVDQYGTLREAELRCVKRWSKGNDFESILTLIGKGKPIGFLTLSELALEEEQGGPPFPTTGQPIKIEKPDTPDWDSDNTDGSETDFDGTGGTDRINIQCDTPLGCQDLCHLIVAIYENLAWHQIDPTWAKPI